MNTNQPNSDNPLSKPTPQIPSSIEPWQITAYALGELEGEALADVESWISKNPSAVAEVQAIRDTATQIQKQLATSTLNGGLDSRRSEQVLQEITGSNTAISNTAISNTAISNTAISGCNTGTATVQLRTSYDEGVRLKRFRRYRTMGLIASGIAASLVAFRFSPWYPERVEITSGTRTSYNIQDNANGASFESSGDSRTVSEVKAKAHTADLVDKEVASEPQRGLSRDANSSALRRNSAAKENLGIVPGSGGLPESVAKRIDETSALMKGMVEEPQSGEKARNRAEENLERARGSLSPSISGMGAMKGMGGMGVMEFSIPAEPSGERGKRNPELDRPYQLPDELKANVPSFRGGAENASGDRFEPIVETPFAEVTQSPQSTFSIDVDTASYSKIRQYISGHVAPNPSAVRIEEMINYFDYNYPGPTDGTPFAAHMKMTICPWNTEHRLVRVAVQAKKVNEEQRPASNLVFLIDVSGSMAQENKLPLVKRTLTLLASQLREQDRVAIVVYAGAAGCVLPSTSGASKDRIMAAIHELQSGGSTNGGQGIELAYRIAKENYVDGGVNRVILCTDGDFNVGVTGTDQLVSMMQENAKSNVFLTCLGYGIGNYNDSMMEQISNKGNGNYGMVDSEMEARKIMVEQLSGTLMTVAKDVKIQIEFNPQKVASYRLIGYENRRLATQDFDNDKKDAGEIGAGHRVTALYEIVPVGKDGPGVSGDELRYGKKQPEGPAKPSVDTEPSSELANEWMLLKIRSKQPEASESTKQEFVLKDEGQQEDSYPGERADLDWAVSVAEFGLLLRKSQMAPGIDWDRMIARATECVGEDRYRRECLELMRQARRTVGR